MQHILKKLVSPDCLLSRTDALSSPPQVPAANGLYAWFFRNAPDIVPTQDCTTLDDLVLLYVGISPFRAPSRSNLRKRIRQHYTSDAYGSTLRQTLGVLLAEQSGFPLRRVGNGKRMTLTHLGEQWLDRWMEQNAFVTCVENPEPWLIEEEVFQRLSLPLNIQGNQHHAFSSTLKRLRIDANARARELPVINQTGQTRRRPSDATGRTNIATTG
ncbi:GIY-YIG nuclease family protein [Seohaeicola saemankumensis]|uniref:GIY-YIG nuclease family protein n=1 Tax=Seohaeicola saemankumensis TaxID=481181 RepID=A0ABW3TB41_9RHOB